MKVIITNTTLVNGGDAAIVFAMIEMLRHTFGQDTVVNVLDSMATTTRRYYPELEISQLISIQPRATGGRASRLLTRLGRRISRLRVAIALGMLSRGMDISRLVLSKDMRLVFRHYADADMVISVAGTYLVDNYDISPRLRELDVAMAYGKRPLFYTQSLGPFEKRQMGEMLTAYFDRAPLILLRDARSRSSVEALGVDPAKIHVLADCVFGLAQAGRLAAAENRQGPVRRVAISVRDWPFFRDGASAAGMERYISGVAKAA
ncbi:MAG: polysaccharide pyruvyl transferase family protein [Rhodospirillaceae bacterium]|nr:polysaccharide pyruvyl transferase family protein [Rhodospirillaceae bacterium]